MRFRNVFIEGIESHQCQIEKSLFFHFISSQSNDIWTNAKITVIQKLINVPKFHYLIFNIISSVLIKTQFKTCKT